jgi:hypothetical protein
MSSMKIENLSHGMESVNYIKLNVFLVFNHSLSYCNLYVNCIRRSSIVHLNHNGCSLLANV